jgi:cysteinyl-tRNA synthetase
VNYWLHNEFLVVGKDKTAAPDDGKMSKSSGNFLTLQTLIDRGYDPLDYRFFLLGAHYRSQVAFSWDAMESARSARKALMQRVARLLEQCGGAPPAATPEAEAYRTRFRAALENDLGVPKALPVLQALLKDKGLPPAEKCALVSEMDTVLGLRLGEGAAEAAPAPGAGDAEIAGLIAARAEAKKAKNYALADEIRSGLLGRGIILEDTPGGTVWRKQ